MDGNSLDTETLLRRAEAEDKQALGELLTRHAERLRRMVRLRLDRRLQGRIDVSDVLQEAYLDAMRCFPEYKRQNEMSFFVWLRCITGRRLMDLHRFHLGAQARDARREISLNGGGLPEATSAALAAQLMGICSSPSEAAMRAERRAKIEEALERMDPFDREVLALRHFEQLNNVETAQVLGIHESAASKRHLRALKRLKQLLRTS
jgi:RNA polymerase sigma-70 factor (ECF subfamily)